MNPFSLFSDEQLLAIDGWLEQHEVHKGMHVIECRTAGICEKLNILLAEENRKRRESVNRLNGD